MAQILKFFDEKHIYELDGEMIPCVSEIARFASREIYGDVSQYTLDQAAERGTKVHKATEVLDKYGECEIAEDIALYLKAYVQFVKDYSPEYICIEKAFASQEMRFAGTLDRVAIINGKRIIIDIKTSYQVQKVLARIQLPGYSILYEENEKKPVDELWILHLKNDGTYKIVKIDNDKTLFLACLSLHKALEKKKRKVKDNG